MAGNSTPRPDHHMGRGKTPKSYIQIGGFIALVLLLAALVTWVNMTSKQQTAEVTPTETPAAVTADAAPAEKPAPALVEIESGTVDTLQQVAEPTTPPATPAIQTADARATPALAQAATPADADGADANEPTTAAAEIAAYESASVLRSPKTVNFSFTIYEADENLDPAQIAALQRLMEKDLITRDYMGMYFTKDGIKYTVTDKNGNVEKSSEVSSYMRRILASLFVVSDQTRRAKILSENPNNRRPLTAKDLFGIQRFTGILLDNLRDVIQQSTAADDLLADTADGNAEWIKNRQLQVSQIELVPALIKWDGEVENDTSAEINILTIDGRTDERFIGQRAIIIYDQACGREVINVFTTLGTSIDAGGNAQETRIYGARDLKHTAGRIPQTVNGFTGYPVMLSIQTNPMNTKSAAVAALKRFGASDEQILEALPNAKKEVR